MNTANIDVDKDAYIAELEKALEKYYKAKVSGDEKETKYYQGFARGIVLMLRKMKIVNEVELKKIVSNAELDSPAIFRYEN